MRLALAIVVFGLAALSPYRAQGSLDWRWSFDQAEFFVGPSDSIALSATIFVRPESPAPLTGRASITFQGSLFALYNMDCTWCGDIRLADVNIPPGGSLRFAFGTLSPKSPIAPGTYRNLPDQPLIDLEQLGTRHIPDSPLVIHVVPEPSALALAFLLACIICLLWLNWLHNRKGSW